MHPRMWNKRAEGVVLFVFCCEKQKLNSSNLRLLNQLGYNYGNPRRDSYSGNDWIKEKGRWNHLVVANLWLVSDVCQREAANMKIVNLCGRPISVRNWQGVVAFRSSWLTWFADQGHSEWEGEELQLGIAGDLQGRCCGRWHLLMLAIVEAAASLCLSPLSFWRHSFYYKMFFLDREYLFLTFLASLLYC